MTEKTFVESILHLGDDNLNCRSSEAENEVALLIRSLTQVMDERHGFMAHIVPCCFIYDYRKNEIVYLSQSITHLLGFEREAFLGSNGMFRFMELINPNDFIVYNEQIFPRDIEYLHAFTDEQTTRITFSNNFRVKQNNGLYKTLLMKKCFVTSPTDKKLLYEIGMLTDISSLKKELSITHIIERSGTRDGEAVIKIVTEDFFPEMHASILSAREKEILSHLAKGTKRKEVGVKLFISDNTVANHIKTILRKTNSQNIREAIDICKMNGII